MSKNTNHQSRILETKLIPKEDIWCGCIPAIQFKSEIEFLIHLHEEHGSIFKEILKRYG